LAELFNRVNWVDLIALILLLRISYTSSLIGVGKQILPLVTLVLIVSIILHSYSDIASFFVGRYSFAPSTCEFACYVIMGVVFFVIYHFIGRLSGFFIAVGEAASGGVEKAGGALLGILRSIIIVGLVAIGLLLTPVRFVESSVKGSYSASFFISADLRIYVAAANLIFREERISYREALAKLLAQKKDYIFKPIDVKKKSRFFKEKY